MLRRRKRDEPQSRKPEDSDFKQQRLRAWEPLLTPFWVITTFLSVGLLFLIIGVIALDASNSVVEIEKEYKLQQPLCDLRADPPQTGCCDITDPDRNPGFCDVQVVFDITEQMRPPIYVYYKLTEFYQNHRRYVKSRSDEQLRGESNPDTAPCDPLETMGDKTLYPCGLVASSIFNDTFNPPTLKRSGEPDLVLEDDNWSNRGIAWRSDMDHKFRNRTMDPAKETNVGPNGPLPSVGSEELAVWMRTAGLPIFKKLHRIIKRTSLLKGDQLELTITDTFQVRGFGGSKAVVLSTSSWLGGKNTVLANAYLVVGILCFVVGLIFLALHVFHRRDLGDMKYWNWRS